MKPIRALLMSSMIASAIPAFQAADEATAAGEETAQLEPAVVHSYEGREPDAPWRAHAHRDIERHRKAALSVAIRNAAGAAISGATVTVKMQRHAFGFGSVVNLGAMSRDDADGKRYRELVETYFNKATTESGLRWQDWTRGGPEQVADRKRKLDETLTWLNERNIGVRGHYLMRASLEAGSTPPELLDKRDELLPAFWKHAEEKARWSGGRVAEWDAIDHIVGGDMRIADIYGESVYTEVIKRARGWVPQAELWVNEGNVIAGGGTRIMSYHQAVKKLREAGASPDGIGFMGHFEAGDLPSPEEIYRRLSFFGNEIPRLQITELDVSAGDDETLQADYLRDVLTVAFSHPAVEGVVLWGFWEGQHWRPEAALWRPDWSIKPAGQAWLELVRKDWWTNATGTTDAGGTYLTRAFLGQYIVTATYNGTTQSIEVVLPRGGGTAALTF